MNSDDASIERVRQLIDRADKLRMQSVAIPLKELKALLRICDKARERKHASVKAEPEVN